MCTAEMSLKLNKFSGLKCCRCTQDIQLGTSYYQWLCGHIIAENCIGEQIYSEVGMKCPLCSTMMTRKQYEQWCLQGYIQTKATSLGMRYMTQTTAPLVAQYGTSPILYDFMHYQPRWPYQMRNIGTQSTFPVTQYMTPVAYMAQTGSFQRR